MIIRIAVTALLVATGLVSTQITIGLGDGISYSLLFIGLKFTSFKAFSNLIKLSWIGNVQNCTAANRQFAFCSDITFPVLFKQSTTFSNQSLTVDGIEAELSKSYEAFRFSLYQYDCARQGSATFYSVLVTCEDCLVAYKEWLCLTAFQPCSAQTDPETRICLGVCHRVLQSCPTFLGFDCPVADSISADSYSMDAVKCAKLKPLPASGNGPIPSST